MELRLTIECCFCRSLLLWWLLTPPSFLSTQLLVVTVVLAITLYGSPHPFVLLSPPGSCRASRTQPKVTARKLLVLRLDAVSTSSSSVVTMPGELVTIYASNKSSCCRGGRNSKQSPVLLLSLAVGTAALASVYFFVRFLKRIALSVERTSVVF